MNILITGASRGIGNAIFNKLKGKGNIYITARSEEILMSANADGYCVCDLSEDISSLVNFVKTNKIDVLINNAGDYIYSNIDKMTYQDIDRIYAVNIVSPTKLISAAVPNMKDNRWGRIINIGSISGVMGEANASVYSASKAGLIGLTKALALELAEYNITVNTINPGWVDTELGNNSINDSDFTKEEIIECIPQKRFVTPDEIASYVEYLLSDNARGITGQSVNICAGLSVGI